MINLRDHLRRHFDPEMPGPGKAREIFRQQRVDNDFFAHAARHNRAMRRIGWTEQDALCFFKIAKRRRHAPNQQIRAPALQARQRELRLHAALIADEFVPLVDDNASDRAEIVARVGAREHERQALRRRDQHAGRTARLPGALGGGRVAAANADGPTLAMRGEPVERLVERLGGVRGEGAHRRDPENAKSWRLFRVIRERLPGAEANGQRFAGACRRVQQAAASLRHFAPHFLLEAKRLPAPRRE